MARARTAPLDDVPMPGAVPRGEEAVPSCSSASGRPVTIVKIEDFHCHFCKRAQPTLTEILSRYGDKVKLVHRDFPNRTQRTPCCPIYTSGVLSVPPSG
jgi:protein-disulfide isomerase